jgi:hypothetical protein
VRTALALAVENPHIAVTFLPLACTGASIDAGLLNGQVAHGYLSHALIYLVCKWRASSLARKAKVK